MDMASEWMWARDGEALCGGCGARYEVQATRIGRRRYGYLRCDVCDTVVAEWIDRVAKRARRIDMPPAAVAAAPLPTNAAPR
ncbi:MAG: hypothetical protein AAGM38_12930 [Pseudomonadota bacterium]